MRRAIVTYFVLACSNVLAQLPSSQPRFEVSTVKPSDPQNTDSGRHMNNARLAATDQTLKELIAFAYDIEIDRVFGGPNWVASAKYDIVAKAQDDLGRRIRAADYQPMTQALLAERFKLAIHRENRELPFYVLVVAKGGAKIRLAPADSGSNSLNTNNTHLAASGIPMSMLANFLSRRLQRPVTDRTELSGRYDFKLDWAPDSSPVVRDNDRAAEPLGPSLFTALQEQLGLKLEAKKGPIEVIMIDHAERPKEN